MTQFEHVKDIILKEVSNTALLKIPYFMKNTNIIKKTRLFWPQVQGINTASQFQQIWFSSFREEPAAVWEAFLKIF